MGCDDGFKDLVGRKIIAIYGREKDDELQFETDYGTFRFTCSGDCCSSSWFEHISGVSELVGYTVIKEEKVNMPDIPEKEQEEVDVAYGYQLITDKGRFLIEMRNSSNGYYGGSIDDAQKIVEPTLPKIETDW